MDQAVCSGVDFYKSAEIHDFDDFAFIKFADFCFLNNLPNHLFGGIGALFVRRRNGHDPIIIHIDSCTRRVADFSNGFSSGADEDPDLFRTDLDGRNDGCKFGNILSRLYDGLLHLIQNMKPAIPGLLKGLLHDFLGETVNLDVHLKSRNPVACSGNLEIHVAKMVFVADNIGKDNDLFSVRNQSHSHSGYGFLEGDAGVHEGETTSANAGHGRGTIGFKDFRYHTDGILERVTVRQHRNERPSCERPVTDLPSPRTSQSFCFSDTVRGKIIVEHKGTEAVAVNGLDSLFIPFGSQGGQDHCLCFSPSEKGGSVNAGQHPHNTLYGAHFVKGAAINSLSFIQDHRSNNGFLDAVQKFTDFRFPSLILF